MPSDKLATCFDSAVSWTQHCSGGSTTFFHSHLLFETCSLIYDLWPIHCTIESEWEQILFIPWATATDSEKYERSQTPQRGFLHGGLLQNHCCHNPKCTNICLQTQLTAWPLFQQGCLDHPWAFPGFLDMDEQRNVPDLSSAVWTSTQH